MDPKSPCPDRLFHAGAQEMPMRCKPMLALSIVATVALHGTAQAQDWPLKPVRIVVPFPAGGSTDRITRLVAEELTQAFKHQFVVENRPGAGGAVAAAQIARTEPDGYTLMAGGYGPHVLGPASGVKIDYDPITDFTHIVMMGGESYIFAAHAAFSRPMPRSAPRRWEKSSSASTRAASRSTSDRPEPARSGN